MANVTMQMTLLKYADLMVLLVIFGLCQDVQCLTPTNFLKRVGLFGNDMSDFDPDNLGGLNRLFNLLSQMRNNVESGVKYADYLDSIMPPEVDPPETAVKYSPDQFLRIGRSSNTPTDQTKRARPSLSRFVRFGKRSTSQENNEDESNEKRSSYLRIGKLPSTAFLNFAFGQPSRYRKLRDSQISKSSVLRMG
ncbi:hypothetical protein LOTGIDRAFT_160519 [Lottia gigantea]|uniref:Uncharacterized protein n=1 Tax=Lottia gigantea TaxID=225164 RepID=V3ZV78_LOTGI|nr:hypothetical protein LOTGIDRAFT_160519 [Lottia gigantea]ESO95383.1 hypothetical protein LOTGIDRAFT_160519 [Lottia gigantea]